MNDTEHGRDEFSITVEGPKFAREQFAAAIEDLAASDVVEIDVTPTLIDESEHSVEFESADKLLEADNDDD